CPDTRANKLAECEALAWKWFLRLHEQGKDVNQFLMAFIFLVARAVKSGRRACGMERTDDVLSPVAQRRHDFTVEALPSSTRRSTEPRTRWVGGPRPRGVVEAGENVLDLVGGSGATLIACAQAGRNAFLMKR